MPPRWSRIPTRQDPEYRKLDDRMNFAVHVAVFALCNSGAWFFRTLHHQTWPWTVWLTGIWLAVLAGHAIYIFAVADYSKESTG